MRWSHQNWNALLFSRYVLRPPSRVTGSTNMKNVILCYRGSIPLDPGRRTDTHEARRKREARGIQASKEGRVGREAWLSARINQPNAKRQSRWTWMRLADLFSGSTRLAQPSRLAPLVKMDVWHLYQQSDTTTSTTLFLFLSVQDDENGKQTRDNISKQLQAFNQATAINGIEKVR